jgi:hypothetical protein
VLDDWKGNERKNVSCCDSTGCGNEWKKRNFHLHYAASTVYVNEFQNWTEKGTMSSEHSVSEWINEKWAQKVSCY